MFSGVHRLPLTEMGHGLSGSKYGVRSMYLLRDLGLGNEKRSRGETPFQISNWTCSIVSSIPNPPSAIVVLIVGIFFYAALYNPNFSFAGLVAGKDTKGTFMGFSMNKTVFRLRICRVYW